MNNLQATINRIYNEPTISSEEVLVLVCPPLNKQKFNSDIFWGRFSYLWKKPKEFAAIQKSNYQTWQCYDDEINACVVQSLLKIEHLHSVKVSIDASFKTFKKCVKSKQFAAIFLIAHHINTKDYTGIEFSEGGINTALVYQFLHDQQKVSPLPQLVFLVCHSNSFLIDEKPRLDTLMGFTNWSIPLKGGVNFLEKWIAQLKLSKVLSVAYELAIKDYFSEKNDNQ